MTRSPSPRPHPSLTRTPPRPPLIIPPTVDRLRPLCVRLRTRCHRAFALLVCTLILSVVLINTRGLSAIHVSSKHPVLVFVQVQEGRGRRGERGERVTKLKELGAREEERIVVVGTVILRDDVFLDMLLVRSVRLRTHRHFDRPRSSPKVTYFTYSVDPCPLPGSCSDPDRQN